MRLSCLRLPLLLVFVAMGVSSHATMMDIPLEDRVLSSDLVVVGTLRGVILKEGLDRNSGAGDIVVQEVLWGDTKKGDCLRLAWTQITQGSTCGTPHHQEYANQPKVWLLKGDRRQGVTSEYACTLDIGTYKSVLRVLRDYPVQLRVVNSLEVTGTPCFLQIAFRNATDKPRIFSIPRYENGKLTLPPNIDLRQEKGSTPLLALNGRLVHAPTKPITIPPRGEAKVVVNLATVYGDQIDNSSPEFLLTVGGKKSANSVRIWRETLEESVRDMEEESEEEIIYLPFVGHCEVATLWRFTFVICVCSGVWIWQKARCYFA